MEPPFLGHLQIYDRNVRDLHSAFADGTYEPLVASPKRLAGTLLLAGYLLLPPSSSAFVRHARFPVWYTYAFSCLDCLLHLRTASHAVAYIIGAAFAFGPLWTAKLLIFSDMRLEARRVEEKPVSGRRGWDQDTPVKPNGMAQPELQQWHSPKAVDATRGPDDKMLGPDYYWQALPAGFLARLGWVADLGLALRGAGWTHAIRSIPAAPPDSPAAHAAGAPQHGFTTRAAALRHHSYIFLTRYLFLDLLHTLVTRDPYFLGLGASAALPPSFFSPYLATHPRALHAARTLAVFFLTRAALELAHSAGALLCLGAPGGRRLLGLRAAPWYQAPFYGPVRRVATHGLAGFWGAHWHQLLRAGLAAAGAALGRWRGWDPRSPRAKTAGVALAFLGSGTVHAVAARFSLARRPAGALPAGLGSLLFFAVQAPALAGEAALTAALAKRAGVQRWVPGWAREALTFALVTLWLLATAPLFVDDVAAAGVFLFEPCPVSLARLLGLGGSDRMVWRWWARNVFWHSGARWYESGLAF